jgi:hypothetical protein
MNTNKKQPAHEIRIGTVKAAIWEQTSRDNSWHNVTFSRSYKDGEEWKSTESFNRDDLLVVAKLADSAHTWILEQRKESSRSEAPRR